MRIEYRAIDEVRPYENNPREIDDKAVAKVAESIKEFGFKVPIVVDRSGVIVTGHTRLKAARELGMERVPVVVADDLTDEQVSAFRLADNKVFEFSGWDFMKLSQELEEASDILDMELFGFEVDSYMEDIDGLFTDDVETGSKEERRPERFLCPSCGGVIEI